MKKNLNSEYHRGKWNERVVTELPLFKLWPSVKKCTMANANGSPFFDNVKDSIEKNGMRFPILVVQSDYAELVKQKARFKQGMCELPTEEDFTGFTVWGGSNRFWVAKELGYDTVDVVIYKTFQNAWNDQHLHRKPYKEELYT
jgi:hypothetical protein